MLLLATAVALIWVNSPWGDSYDAFWGSPVNLSVNDFVNDALMALFFFVVGLEIKRELVDGQLQNMKDAALPAVAALGGMIVPALLFFVINVGGPGEGGWGIPMATDIAFAVGIVSLLGDRISRRLKVFLLSLAIVDDIGAIIVIALFYSAGISGAWLAATVALLGLIFVLGKLRVWWIPVYVLLGAIVWWTTFRSGIHATIAGVALGLLTPDVRYASFHIRESMSVAERLETVMHPITSYAIIPIFALANAGVRMNGDIISAAFQSRVTWGIIIGLVVGKTVGITVFSLIATKLGIAKRPDALTFRTLVGLAMIAGIGFTVSLFVSNLAFGDVEHHDEVALVSEAPGELAFTEADETHDDSHVDDAHDDDSHSETASGDVEGGTLQDNSKIGILFASIIASIGGLLILSGSTAPDDE
ncbi:UNVERIFIED_CONTAM: hypothetical protein GTU68_031998 [Idotea baltica]|nr:hypothetical protein [Idotea baltica]